MPAQAHQQHTRCAGPWPMIDDPPVDAVVLQAQPDGAEAAPVPAPRVLGVVGVLPAPGLGLRIDGREMETKTRWENASAGRGQWNYDACLKSNNMFDDPSYHLRRSIYIYIYVLVGVLSYMQERGRMLQT